MIITDFLHIYSVTMKSLLHAPYNKNCIITGLNGDLSLTNRLRELGFHAGCTVQVLGQAPFNGPLIVRLHNSILALRRGEAECLLIQEA